MARGYCYEVSSNIEDFPVGDLREDDLYEYAGHNFDYSSDIGEEEQRTLRSDLIGVFNKIGCLLGVEDDIPYVVFSEQPKWKYFQDRFFKLQEYVKNLSLEEFSNGDEAKYNICLLTDNVYSDAIYLNGTYYDSFDYFIRNAEAGKKYFLGNVVLLH